MGSNNYTEIDAFFIAHAGLGDDEYQKLGYGAGALIAVHSSGEKLSTIVMAATYDKDDDRWKSSEFLRDIAEARYEFTAPSPVVFFTNRCYISRDDMRSRNMDLLHRLQKLPDGTPEFGVYAESITWPDQSDLVEHQMLGLPSQWWMRNNGMSANPLNPDRRERMRTAFWREFTEAVESRWESARYIRIDGRVKQAIPDTTRGSYLDSRHLEHMARFPDFQEHAGVFALKNLQPHKGGYFMIRVACQHAEWERVSANLNTLYDEVESVQENNRTRKESGSISIQMQVWGADASLEVLDLEFNDTKPRKVFTIESQLAYDLGTVRADSIESLNLVDGD